MKRILDVAVVTVAATALLSIFYILLTRQSITAVPDVVWGAAIAAASTWLGIWLKLSHDSKERDRERQAALRRDVYLPSTRSIADMLHHIMNSYDVEESGPAQYAPAIAQMLLIGTDETVQAVKALDDYIVEALCQLMPIKAEIGMRRQKLATLMDTSQANAKKIDQCVEETRQYNMSGVHDPKKWEVIQGHYNLYVKFRDEALEAHQDEARELVKLTNTCAAKCFELAQQALVHLTPLIVAVRKELGTPFNDVAFRRIEELSCKRWKTNVEECISSLGGVYDRVLTSTPSPELPDEEPNA